MNMYTVWTQHVGITTNYDFFPFWFFIEHSITSTLQLVLFINLIIRNHKVDLL